MKCPLNAIIAIAAGVPVLLMAGCRTRTHSVETEARTAQTAAVTAASTTVAAQSARNADTVRASLKAVDTLRIVERDSAGRPNLVVWGRNYGFDGLANSMRTFNDFNATVANAASATASSQSEAKKDTVKTSPGIELWLGMVAVALVLLNVIYVIIKDWLWPRMKR